MKPWVISACTALSLSHAAISAPASVMKPDTIRFDERLVDAQQRLDDVCESLTLRQIEPVQIPGVAVQTQLDCQGLEMAGAERLAEFVYGDGQLYMVWVLVDAEELDGLASSMAQVYGAPSHSSDVFSAFTQHRTALRRDVPEILFYAPVASAQFEGWFSQQSQ